jgi:hypothetical protein
MPAGGWLLGHLPVSAAIAGMSATVPPLVTHVAEQADPRARDWDLGAWTGRSLTEIAATSPQDLQRWSTDPDSAGHGGESLQQLRARAMNWLDRLKTPTVPTPPHGTRRLRHGAFSDRRGALRSERRAVGLPCC